MMKILKFLVPFFSGVLMASLFSNVFLGKANNGESEARLAKKKSAGLRKREIGFEDRKFEVALGRFAKLKRFEDEIRGTSWNESLGQRRRLFSSNEGEEYCRLFFESWAAEDPDAALEAAQASENRLFSQMALGAVLLQVRSDDGERALSMLSGLPMSRHVAGISSEFFGEWASSNLDELLYLAEDIEDPTHRINALQAVGRSLAERSPSEAIEWLEGVESLAEDDSVLSSILSKWAETDPLDAVAYIKNNKFDSSLNRSVMNSWVKSDPEEAIGWIVNMSGSEDKNSLLFYSMISLQEGSFTSSEMLGFLNVLPVGNMKDQALQVVMQNWQGANFDEIASEMYLSVNSVSGTPGERRISEEWVKNDLEGAERFLKEHPENSKIKFLKIKVIEEKIRRDSAEALVLVEEMKNLKSNILLRNVAKNLLDVDTEVAESFMQSLKDVPDFKKHIVDFTQVYGANKPELALRWVTDNLTGEELEIGISSSFEGWVDVNEYEAAKFIGSMAPSDSRDIAAAVLIDSLIESDFASALEWSTTVQGEERKNAVFQSIREKVGANPSQEQLEIILSGGLSDDEVRLLEGKAEGVLSQ